MGVSSLTSKIQSNLYIKATQGNLKIWPLYTVVCYIEMSFKKSLKIPKG